MQPRGGHAASVTFTNLSFLPSPPTQTLIPAAASLSLTVSHSESAPALLWRWMCEIVSSLDVSGQVTATGLKPSDLCVWVCVCAFVCVR